MKLIKLASMIFVGLILLIAVCMIGVLILTWLDCSDEVVFWGGYIWVIIVLAFMLAIVMKD